MLLGTVDAGYLYRYMYTISCNLQLVGTALDALTIKLMSFLTSNHEVVVAVADSLTDRSSEAGLSSRCC